MAATFPGGVKVFTTKQAGDQIASAHINDLQAEVVAVETELKKTTGSVVDHGGLTGLGDNDHPQYLLATGKAADSDKLDGIDSTGFATSTHSHDHGALAGLSDNDHPQYSLATHSHLKAAEVTRVATQSIETSEHTAIVWDTEVLDTSNFWSSGKNITIPQDGVYFINAYALFDGFTTGMALLEIFFNNETNARVIQGYLLNQYGIHMSLTTIQSLNANDTVHIKVFQNSGSANNVGGSSYPARIVVAKLA